MTEKEKIIRALISEAQQALIMAEDERWPDIIADSKAVIAFLERKINSVSA